MIGSDAMRLGFDADGVVVQSAPVAWRAEEDILALFGRRPTIGSRAEHLRLFGREAQAVLAGPDRATLRAMHRLLMRHRAQDVAADRDVLAIVAQLNFKPIMITAAYAEGIEAALGEEAARFARIIGRESGPKEKLLAGAAARGLSWFVADTYRDIERCRACGIHCVAVGWGYDSPSDLIAANPAAFAKNPAELAGILAGLGFTTSMEV